MEHRQRPIMTVLKGGPGTSEGGEAEAMLRIANAIQAELPAITSPHWHDALAALRVRLSESASRRSQPPPRLASSA